MPMGRIKSIMKRIKLIDEDISANTDTDSSRLVHMRATAACCSSGSQEAPVPKHPSVFDDFEKIFFMSALVSP